MTMRKTILTAIAVLAIGGTATGIMIAQAQTAPPPPGVGAPPPPDGPRFTGWMQRMHQWRDGRGPMNRQTFALVYQQEDRKLTQADVQKIAEAFLLWRGNHTWKVVNVAAVSDAAIGFSLATQDGSVIASFTMDPHTGRITRTA
jgi:hypothetical protein